MTIAYPLFILFTGLVVVVVGIVVLRMHAFLALISAATVVSLLAPGEWSEKIPRVAEAFGSTAAGVGIVIALAAIIGMAMTASGAADRIVRQSVDYLHGAHGPRSKSCGRVAAGGSALAFDYRAGYRGEIRSGVFSYLLRLAQ